MTDNFMVWFGVLLLCGCAFLGIDCAGGSDRSEPVTVVDLSYTPASTVQGHGTASDGSTITTLATEPEKWTLLVDRHGDVISVPSDKTSFLAAKPGSPATLAYRKGWMTGFEFFVKGTVP